MRYGTSAVQGDGGVVRSERASANVQRLLPVSLRCAHLGHRRPPLPTPVVDDSQHAAGWVIAVEAGLMATEWPVLNVWDAILRFWS
jgi:hypothetical protein